MGIDIGDQNTRVSVVKRRGVVTCLNEASKRLSPSIIAIEGEKCDERVIASPMLAPGKRNSILGFKHCIGRDFDDPVVQEEMKKSKLPLVKGANGEVMVRLKYGEEERDFALESLYAMLLKKQQHTATTEISEKDRAPPITDAVVTVPDYYTDRQRQSIVNACKIAGITLLQIMSEHAATALCYALQRTEVMPKDEDEVMTVAFIDIGYSSTSVSFVDYTQSGMKVRGVASDSKLGGRDLDILFMERFGKEFKEKYGCDHTTSLKATAKLQKACEKAKKDLATGGPLAQVKIEFFMDGKDVRGVIKKEEFAELCGPFVKRVIGLIEKAMADADIKDISKVKYVEGVGGGSRPWPIKEAVSKFFGKPVTATINQDEATSNGAALQAARLTPYLRVKNVAVSDVVPRSVAFTKEGGKEIQIFNRKKDTVPATKMLTYKNTGDFRISAAFTDNTSDISEPRTGEEKATWLVSAPAANNSRTEQVKIKIRLTDDGITSIENIELHEHVKMMVPKPTVAPTPAPTTNGTKETKKEAKEETKEVEMEEVTKIYTSLLKYVVEKGHVGLSEKELGDLMEFERVMASRDEEIEIRDKAANDLEDYIMTTSTKIEPSGAYGKLATEDERNTIEEALMEAEEWFGSPECRQATTSILEDKLKEIKNITSVVEERYNVFKTIDDSKESLRTTLFSCRKEAKTQLPAYAHISQEDRDKILNACDDATAWLKGEEEKDSKRAGYEPPLLGAKEIIEKENAVRKLTSDIMSQPAPTPEPTPAPTTPPPTTEGAKKEEATEAQGETPMETEPAADVGGGEQNMEVEEEKPVAF